MEEQTGNTEKHLAYLKQAVEDFPQSPSPLRRNWHTPALSKRVAKSMTPLRFLRPLQQNAAPEVRAPALCGLARDAERAGGRVTARDLYREAVRDAAWNTPDWEEAADGLGRLNAELIFSVSPPPRARSTVSSGATTSPIIGMKLNTTQGLLMRANGLTKDTTLNVGNRLKYNTPKDFRNHHHERSTCRLFLLDGDGLLFKRYLTGLGRPGHETTLGEFRIGNKQVDPTWFKPNAGPIPPGDPENELGSRWMPLVPEREELPTDLGIHGTIAPDTIGKHTSSGCARMHNADVEELYDLVVRSTPVEIVETVEPRDLGL